MKKVSSFLLTLLFVLSVGVLSAFAALNENEAQSNDTEVFEDAEVEVPSEPQSVPFDSVAPYYIYYQSTSPSGVPSSDTNSGLHPEQALATWNRLFTTLSETGGTAVIPGKGYIGADFTFPSLAQPLTITAYDEQNDIKYAGTLEVAPTKAGDAYTDGTQYGMFMIYNYCTLTIEGEYIFDDIDIIERTETGSNARGYKDTGTSRISVSSSGKLVIKDTCSILTMTDASESIILNVETGGYAYLHVLGFEKYTGTGTIVLDRALVELGEATADAFADFDGKVVYQDGTAAFSDDANTPDDPAESGNTVYLSNLGSDSNDGSAPETAVLTMHKAYKLLGDNGGTIVIVDTFTQYYNFTAPAHKGKITIKGLTEDSVYRVAASRRYYLGGETEFTDIDIKANGSATWFLVCRFHDLTISESVSVTRTGNFYILMGGAAYSGGGSDYTPSDCTLTVNGGDWAEIIGLLRSGLSTYSQEVCKTPSDFEGVDLTFNLGGNAKVNKVFAYSRQGGTTCVFSAKNATMTVNLMGGVITHFFAQNDYKGYSVGYGGGLTVNVGKDFDLANSFNANATIDADRLGKDDVYYALSGESVYGGNALTTDRKLNNALLIIDESIYDEVISTNKINTDTFARIQSSADPITPIEPTIPEYLVWHYDSSTQTLTISGNADMIDYTYYMDTPWYGYRSKIRNVVIEGATSIVQYAFYDCTSLTSISIPDSVTSIGWGAFYNCTSLESITISDSVTSIGLGAFEYCTNLTSITIPVSLTSIEDQVFHGCNSLTSITIPDSVTSIGNSAFSGCTSLTSIDIPDSVTSIGNYAFEYCTSLTSITIPDSVTSIGYGAFAYCTSLTNINIPANVTSIGQWAFSYCTSLTSIYYNAVNVADLSMYNNVFSCAGQTGDGIKVTIGKDVKHIPERLFYPNIMNESYFPKITEVVFEEGSVCESIGNYAFCNSTSLTSITIPDGVTSIGEYAFAYCTSLTSITIPDSVTSIGNSAFSGCTSLAYNTYNGDKYLGNTYNPYVVLMDTASTTMTSFSILSDTKIIYDSAFYNCTSLTSISIPDGVTSIGYSAFYNCTSLTSIEVDANNPVYHSKNNCLIKTADKILILGCKNSIIPADGSVTSIYDYAFYNCTSLTSISIPDGVTSIGEYAFAYCTSLTSIAIPDGVISIGDCAFAYCTSLTSITIPDSVTSISYGAFAYCTSLASITIPDSVTSIGYRAFRGCTSLTSIDIPDSVTSIDYEAFYNCTSLTSITIPDSVTSIGSYAFYNCTSLTSISIPEGVTSIGDDAFYYCTSLTSVYYCGTAEQWNKISIGSYNSPLTSATRMYHKYELTTVTEPTCTEDGIGESICEFCRETERVVLPALGHRVVCEALVDAIQIKNDNTYPFVFSGGVYSSTNKSHSSKSTFTITALYDCTVKLEYSVSSESHFDKLIISKNGTDLSTISGVVSWTAVEISLKAGDQLTISYSKNSSQSNNADTGYFKFTCDQILGNKDIPADELEPTCKDAVICSYCNEVIKPMSTEHTYGDWYVKTAPACTEEGVEERICTNSCGLSETRSIPATGHSYSEWNILTEPTPESEGFKSRICANCYDEVFEMIYYASGDVDGDGELTNSDITLALRVMSGWETDADMALVDHNYDGIINNRDIIALIQRLAGWN